MPKNLLESKLITDEQWAEYQSLKSKLEQANAVIDTNLELIEHLKVEQTKIVFNTLAKLINENQTCTYRCLIYDLLGFKPENYGELISGLEITNALVELQTLKDENKHLQEYNDRLLKKFIRKAVKDISE